ncbi:heme-binding protein [Oxalobacteraceae bacterium OM1]|nr:heme-binding protein [Oxalobacteraceae bacterium OM1]
MWKWKPLAAALLCGLALHGAASAKADPQKVLRVAFDAADDGFDLVKTNNSLYSTWVGQGIYEPLLQYDYLARPVKLVPNTAESMPDVSADGKVYIFHVKKGIYFTPDPAFKGAKRELTAADYAYTIKRIMDPVNRSPAASSFEGRIAGLDELVATARKGGRFDYDAPLQGLQTPDKYTLRIELTRPDPTLLYTLAIGQTGAVAREVIEHYGQETRSHPVGTGPYMLKEYIPHSKIVLEANPDYRGFVWDFQSTGDKWDEQLIKEMKGKQMPQVGRVEAYIIEEHQSRWLAFGGGQIDADWVVDTVTNKVLDKGRLKPEFADKGIRLYRFVNTDLVYAIMNFRDPVLGGYTPEKIALRRAIVMAYNLDEEIVQARQGQAIHAQSAIPPGIPGYDPAYRSSIGYDPELAAKLLDYFGYKKGKDGWRTMPDGSPLVIKMSTSPSARDQLLSEVWKRSLDKINVRMEFPVASWSDNLKAASECKLMMWALGTTFGIPDPFDFYDTLAGSNIGQGNIGCYDSPAFNKLYAQTRVMPDGPERQALLTQMSRQVEADTAVVMQLHRYRNWLIQPWVKGFKQHPFQYNNWKYLDIEQH